MAILYSMEILTRAITNANTPDNQHDPARVVISSYILGPISSFHI